MVMIPVAIEPSEILKRKKKLEKSIKDNKNLIENETNAQIGSKEYSHEKNVKSVFLQVPGGIKKIDESADENENNEEKFFKSSEALAEDQKAKSHEDALYKSYSSLNFIATMHSSRHLNEPISENEKNVEANNADEVKTFNFKILFNVLFLFFAISNFLTSLGFNAPYILLPAQAKSYMISEANADWLIQTIGISNLIGRIVLGYLSDLKSVNRLYLYSTVLTLCGIANLIEPFLKTFPLLLVYAAVFGFTNGSFTTVFFHEKYIKNYIICIYLRWLCYINSLVAS
jgi:hypothetical protein